VVSGLGDELQVGRKKTKGLSQKYLQPPRVSQDFFSFGDFRILDVVEIAFRPTFGTAPWGADSSSSPAGEKRAQDGG